MSVKITSAEQLKNIKIVVRPKIAKKNSNSASNLSGYDVEYYHMGEEADVMIHPVFQIMDCNMQGPFLPFKNIVSNFDVGPTVPIVKAVLPTNRPEFKLVSELERRINTAAAIYAYGLDDAIDIIYKDTVVEDEEKPVKFAYAVQRNGTEVRIIKSMIAQKANDMPFLRYMPGAGYMYDELFFPKENLFHGEQNNRVYYKEFRISTEINEARKARKKSEDATSEMQTVQYWGFDILKAKSRTEDMGLIGNDDLCNKTKPITTPTGKNTFNGGIAWTVSGVLAPVGRSKLNIYMYGAVFYHEIQDSSPRRYLGMKVVDEIEGTTTSLALIKSKAAVTSSATNASGSATLEAEEIDG